jgi:ABC-2 type transport system ATP-binding protein
MSILVSAQNLHKSYGAKQALKPSSFELPAGRVIGLIGPNGAGKSTLINCLLGLMAYEGTLKVLDRNPYQERAALMQDVSFIADVATLPKWMQVGTLLDTVAGLHPKFDKAKALKRLETTQIKLDSKIKALSKGMTVQLHLALVLAINARLLVLDEPTLGLDILNRRAFYDAILSDYFDETRTILITTHQVEEIEQILTHAMFIRDGEIILNQSLEDLNERFLCVEASEAHWAAAQALRPIFERRVLGRTTFVFDGVARAQLASFGEVRRVGLADLFVAHMSTQHFAHQAA